MNLDQIINQRTDISNYLIHWTNPRIFWTIIHSGFLISSHSPKPSWWDSPDDKGKPPIRGGTAVCFSETPIGNYLQSIVTRDSYRLNNWGIAIPKRALYAYGGRPVLYGDEDFFSRLRKEDEYLFCHFDYYFKQGPIDWTHEREWRTRPNLQVNDKIGLTSKAIILRLFFDEDSSFGITGVVKGEALVPIHFTNSGKNIEIHLPQDPQFVILVKMERDKERVKTFIEKILKLETEHVFHSNIKEYRTKYLLALPKVKMVSLDYARYGRDYKGCWRLEDLLDDAGKSLNKSDIAGLWDRARTENRRQVLNLIGPILTELKAYEYCEWSKLDPQTRQQIEGNEQVIKILEITQ